MNRERRLKVAMRRSTTMSSIEVTVGGQLIQSLLERRARVILQGCLIAAQR